MPSKKIFLDVSPKAPAPEPLPVEKVEPASAFLTKERREERRSPLVQKPFDPGDMTGDGSARKRLAWIIGIALVALVVLSVTVASVFASATVSITPKNEQADITSILKTFNADKTSDPLQYSVLQITDTESVSVPASGKKNVERKAGGKVTLYNTYSKQAVKIVGNTRFQDPAGDIFRSFSSVNIPGYKQDSAGKIMPGSVEVSVSAAAPGTAYNIGPSSFTLPGLAGSPLDGKVYAKSAEPMTGGFLGEVNIVSDSDLAKAKSTLEGIVTQALLTKVKGKVPADKIFFPDAYSTSLTFNEYGNASSTDGASTDKQSVSMDGSISVLLYDKAALGTYLANRFLPTAEGANVAISNWDGITGDVTVPADIAGADELDLKVSGLAKFVWQVDEAKLKSDLAGTPKAGYTKIFLNYPAVSRADVSVSPFWARSFPSNPKRINIKEVVP